MASPNDWWRATFARDGIPPERALIIQYAAEGVAAAITLGAYITADEVDRARTALLELAEP